MNYIWQFNEPERNSQEIANSLAKELDIDPTLGKLLVDRGIKTVEEARTFFRPQLTSLLDPFLFRDMAVAVKRMNDALGRKERILIYGDYDVDGVTAVALVYKFLLQYYSNIDYYIPDRNDEGYGVSLRGIDYAVETEKR